jgi:metallo-beta-lactamase family protein
MNDSSKGTHPFKITFCSGAGTVTGANFLIEADGKKILVDCGLVQGLSIADRENWDEWLYDPKSIDMLIVTHAHIDHIGRIPRLVNDGFVNKIYSSDPTASLVEPMLEDTMAILSHDRENGLDAIYTSDNIKKSVSLFDGLPYHKVIELTPNFSFKLLDAGHILGSAMIEFSFHGKKILFTGDLGNSPSPLLPDTEKIKDIDYLIMESVYGDRNHESRDERKSRLEEVIEDNYRKKGALVIPTFSLERSQELLFEINSLVTNQRVPRMPIFFDSPLAIRLTDIYRKFSEYFNDEAKKTISSGDDIFNFPGLRVTEETDESKDILRTPKPKIIIAGSGMSNGGRIIHHEKNYLPDKNSTLLLIGYQSAGTLGRLIESGAKEVFIQGMKIPIHANIVKISGYSGHKDSDNLVDFVSQTIDSLKHIYVVMGEPKSSLFLVQKLRDYLGVDATAPDARETIEIMC